MVQICLAEERDNLRPDSWGKLETVPWTNRKRDRLRHKKCVCWYLLSKINDFKKRWKKVNMVKYPVLCHFMIGESYKTN